MDLGWREEALGLGHAGHEVAAHAHLLHPYASHPLDVRGGQVSRPVFLNHVHAAVSLLHICLLNLQPPVGQLHLAQVELCK